MNQTAKHNIIVGTVLLFVFAIFTWLVQMVDVKPLGVDGTNIGFSTLNVAFHKLCEVHMILYYITDWAGLVPIFVAFGFALLGLYQLITRRNLLKVDSDILILGVYYLVVIGLYLGFEMIPINYRPIRIDGFMETSYPSSTTLLVLAVMPTLMEQISRRCKSWFIKVNVVVITIAFSAFMVVGRLVSGVHWFTDILGSIILSAGLFFIYRGFVLVFDKKIG